MDKFFVFNLYLTILALAAVVVVGVMVLRRRDVPGALPYSLMIVCVVVWLCGYTLEVLVPGLPEKLFFDNLQFLPMLTLVPLGVWFLAEFTDTHWRVSTYGLFITGITSIVLFFLTTTNGLSVVQRPDAHLVYEHQVYLLEYNFNFWDYASVVYLFGVFLAIIGAFTIYGSRQPRIYHPQLTAIILGFIAPLLFYTLVFANVRIGFQRDPAPYSFALSTALIAWGLLRYRLFDLRPVAVDAVLGRIRDAVLMIDRSGLVMDLNRAARAIPWLPPEVIGRPVIPLFADCCDFPTRLDPPVTLDMECAFHTGGAPAVYEVTLTPLYERRGVFAGHVLVLHDITRRKQIEQELRESHAELEQRVGERTAELSHTVALLRSSEEKLRGSFARLNRLHEIDALILARAELRLTLGQVARAAREELAAEGVMFFLIDPLNSAELFRCAEGDFSAERLTEGQRLMEEVLRKQGGISYFYAALPADPAERRAFCAAEPVSVDGAVRGVLALFGSAGSNAFQNDVNFLETLAGQAAIAIAQSDLFTRLEKSNRDLREAYEATITGWARALEIRDKETHGHTDRVVELSLALARSLGYPAEDLDNFRYSVILHDIGKMLVPDSILNKPGKLTPEEWVTMREHVQYGVEILSVNPSLAPVLDVPYCHHEWWDGSGYPRELRAEEIPLSARIFAVVDVYDALVNTRVYREAWEQARVLEYIRGLSGTQFDPSVVKAFLRMMRE